MRETEGLDPMWENAAQRPRGSRVLGAAATVVGGVARRIAPHLLGWASAQRPEFAVAWGAREVRLRRDGLHRGRRSGPGWEDNPRRNYNDAVEKKQQRAAASDAKAGAEGTPEPAAAPPPAPEAPVKVDLSAAALESAVRGAMGIKDGADAAEISRDPEAVRGQLESVRALLQALDDVADFDLVEAVDEELYQLHKAVEYKLRNHKASEAKAQLNDLFK